MAYNPLAVKMLVIVLQYGMLLLICFFLYRIVRIIYWDFHRANKSVIQGESQRSAWLKVLDRGALTMDQAEFPVIESLNIGRGPGNDVIINEPIVSHEHACISYYRNEFLLSDLNSTNGVFLNKVRIQDDTPLRKGDKIQIGSTIFQFEE